MATHPRRPPVSTSLETQVATHYSGRENISREDRKSSPIFYLKNTNNWVKGILISENCNQPQMKVLDLCCGKGGDFLKWSRARCCYVVAVDIARGSLEDAMHRYNGKTPPRYFSLTLIEADVGKVLLSARLPPALKFDVVSCQFSLHYCFGTIERARTFMRNATDKLDIRGRFICTFPNACYLLRRYREAGKGFGNSVYQVNFDNDEPFGAFGARYRFNLVDAVNNVPEYLVHPEVLIKLAEECGMELLVYERFHDFYERQIKKPENKELLFRMNCVDATGTMPQDQWEALGVYSLCVFEKRAQKQNVPKTKAGFTVPPEKNLLSHQIEAWN